MKSRPKIGVAISGGAARGFSFIGVLKVFEKHRIPIDYIAGTSSGAAIGGMFAAGYTTKEIEQILMETNWRDLLDITDLKYGLIGEVKVSKYLNSIFKGRRFEDLEIPLAVTTVNISRGQEVIFDSGDVAKAIHASIAIPGIFVPVKIGKDYYVDGGVIDPIPTKVLNRKQVDVKIGVNLSSKIDSIHFSHVPQKDKHKDWEPLMLKSIDRVKNEIKEYKLFPKSFLQFLSPKKIINIVTHSKTPPILDITSKSFYLMTNELTQCKLELNKPDIIISPQIDNITLFDFHKVREGIKAGEYAARRQLKAIKKLAKIE